ncbi:MAG: DNA recombination protein RmuC [Bacteroidota bacterium]|nr:DNA recombination protein RmuC [Bacteroidota bacterium]
MEILFFLIGLLIGVLVLWIFFTRKIEVLKENTARIKEENVKYKTELESIIKNQDLLDNYMKESIESNVLNAMKLNNESFVSLARQTVEKYFLEADKDMKNRTLEIEKIIDPLKEKIETYDKKITDFQTYTSNSLGGVKTFLTELTQMQQQLAQQTNSLVNALKSPKIRGRWGELGLKRIVEFSGLNQYCDFTEQAHSDGQRPDMIINLPESRQIIVDSKLPLDAYLEAIETDNDVQRLSFYKKHLDAVKTNLKRLAAKNYWKNNEESVDFVVMYIEIEPALNAALMQDTSLILEAMKLNVVIATPTTFIALLQTVAYSWKQYKLSVNSKEILKETQEFYNRVSIFTEHFDKLAGNINKLVESYNGMQGSWNSRINPVLDRIMNLGVDDNKKNVKKIAEIKKHIDS